MFVSTDGRTFKEPPADWTIGPWTDPKKFFANSPQSLAGDLIREGVTGVAGHVAEPYPRRHHPPERPVPRLPLGLQPRRVVLPGHALRELADRRRRRPALRAVPAQGAAAVRHRQGDRPGHRAAGAVLRAAAAGCRRRRGSSRRRRGCCCAPRRGRRRATRPGRTKALEEATALDPQLAAAHLTAGAGVRGGQGLRQGDRRATGRCWPPTRTTPWR